ncbi:MAG: 1,4-dihydroxy-6-naphthoate synthase [Alistipes sp.]|nr:1,4-dihydroxy-6-naphthoate synthase [Candidatus Alistipes equi]
MSLKLNISPCPNDTFAFEALLHGKTGIDLPQLDVRFLDIEELNQQALKGIPDISKISYSILGQISDKYVLLESGSALGRANGQLLIRRADFKGKIKRVASPGLHTTANALLKRYFPDVEEIVPMLFSDIAQYVNNGLADAGVLIHEGRFLYKDQGLELVADLGKLWEKETALPLPLGAIVIKRDIKEPIRRLFDEALKRSVRYAWDHPEQNKAFIKEHAQEMDDTVIEKHIHLFVNNFTESLEEEGHAAVDHFLRVI